MIVRKFNHIGKRETQQDGLWVSEDGRLFAVCDGIGGAANGGLASKVVLSSLSSQYQAHTTESNSTSPEDFISESILKAHRQLQEKILVSPELGKMGTTIALLYFVNDTAHIAHVGDSRILFIEKATGSWVATKDHSIVQDLLSNGFIPDEKAMKSHPEKNKITKALIATKDLHKNEIELSYISDYTNGDLFILATDGALEAYTNSELVDAITNTEKTLLDNWEIFCEQCNTNSIDNNTAILIEI